MKASNNVLVSGLGRLWGLGLKGFRVGFKRVGGWCKLQV